MILHLWHIVNLSPWPFMLSMSILSLPMYLIYFFQGFIFNFNILLFIFMVIFLMMFFWSIDIINEGLKEGFHTFLIQKSLLICFSWFLFSEMMFFASFFWGFFHSSIYPNIEMGLAWPPFFIKDFIFEPFEMPLLNTIILLTSGITLTIAHYFLRKGLTYLVFIWLFMTVLLAWMFILFQAFEYFTANFNISNGIYGSTFFLCTGFHGFHVMIGTILLMIILLRSKFNHFSKMHHLGFTTAAWYWHFVDVVWIFLYIMIYFLGSNLIDLELYFFWEKCQIFYGNQNEMFNVWPVKFNAKLFAMFLNDFKNL